MNERTRALHESTQTTNLDRTVPAVRTLADVRTALAPLFGGDEHALDEEAREFYKLGLKISWTRRGSKRA